MNDIPSEGELKLRKRIARLQKYYDRYEQQLFSIMENLEADDDITTRSKALSDTLNRYDKAAHKFIEMSEELETYLDPKSSSSGLDLEGARREVFERLDRIDESG